MDPITSGQYDEAERWSVRGAISDDEFALVRHDDHGDETFATFFGPDAFVRSMRVLWTVQEAIYDGFDPTVCLRTFEEITRRLGPSENERWCRGHGSPATVWSVANNAGG